MLYMSYALYMSADALHVSAGEHVKCRRQDNLVVSVPQALWNGCLPALIMVSNPTVQYVIYEWLVARLAEWRRSTAVAGGIVFILTS